MEVKPHVNKRVETPVEGSVLYLIFCWELVERIWKIYGKLRVFWDYGDLVQLTWSVNLL